MNTTDGEKTYFCIWNANNGCIKRKFCLKDSFLFVHLEVRDDEERKLGLSESDGNFECWSRFLIDFGSFSRISFLV